MKVFITADIEGITGATHWDETDKEKTESYKEFQKQMTAEVAAACEGALAAGATEVWVKDAHWTARNIIPSKLPEQVRLVRGWSGHPFSMVQELDETFHAAAMIGYHARGGSDTSPLAHTMSGQLAHIRINGRFVSEFLLHAYAAATVGVPVVFVSGDEGLCRDVQALNPNIATNAVMRGIGDSTVSIHPARAVEQIRKGVEQAVRGDVTGCWLALPDHFDVEIRYKRHPQAYRASFYPGAHLSEPHAIRYETDDYVDVMRLLLFTV